MDRPLKTGLKDTGPLGNKALAAPSHCSCCKYYMTVIFFH